MRRGIRCAYDRTRDTDVVLFPEGVLLLNPTASAVLDACDGATSIAAITHTLATEFHGVQATDILDLLTRLAARRVVDLD
ncbi:pyrroloquinoline quinone biosynthesis peptide chaperone PqqD [Kutzneria viridogrisea]|uniref:pyrroloquinoline quinone biosynthesis peptide chaperone PqqD n=1 Tax=Kutzneria viridogrisea TaxID=47990 RepID=UPI00398D3A36